MHSCWEMRIVAQDLKQRQTCKSLSQLECLIVGGKHSEMVGFHLTEVSKQSMTMSNLQLLLLFL